MAYDQLEGLLALRTNLAKASTFFKRIISYFRHSTPAYFVLWLTSSLTVGEIASNPVQISL